ncbi:MAG: diaminopimelate epimerase [Opitutales bacterium]|nr:diaminopimelate epimerase [Opitutales bacterium]
MELFKYQALGNAYLVCFDPGQLLSLTPKHIRQLCDPHYGLGSDGLLYSYPLPDPGRFRLKIYNPDASIAEKSGNGLRILAQFLFDTFGGDTVLIATDSGDCLCRKSGDTICVDFGEPQFSGSLLPSPNTQAVTLEGNTFNVTAVSMGNPHCVVWVADVQQLKDDYVEHFGPQFETLPIFPEKTNVQFAYVASPDKIWAQIWERGVGRTLSSGSSAAAVFAAAYRQQLCEPTVTVKMPGGSLQMELSGRSILQYGHAERVARCFTF